MNCLELLVDHYSKKNPNRWALALSRAKYKYGKMDVLQELQKEERSLMLQELRFAKDWKNILVNIVKSKIGMKRKGRG